MYEALPFNNIMTISSNKLVLSSLNFMHTQTRILILFTSVTIESSDGVKDPALETKTRSRLWL